MTFKNLRQILKALADDNRIRILYLLKRHGELTVSKICSILKAKQPTTSKHLQRLRLLGIVSDRRAGSCVFYRINHISESEKIIDFLFTAFRDLQVIKTDP